MAVRPLSQRQRMQMALWKWKIRAGKALFALRTTVEEDILEHIRDVSTLKEAWDILTKLFSRKNVSKVQFLESDMTNAQYSQKVKVLCCEIFELDTDSPIKETRIEMHHHP